MENSDDKTEQPTSKKIRDARKKGTVVKSTEVLIGTQILLVVLFFWAVGRNFLMN